MDDVQRSAGGLCPSDCTLIGFALNELGTGHVVIPCIGLAFADVLLNQSVDHLVVLCVNTDLSTDLLGVLQNLVEDTVGHAEVVNHEHLEGGNTVLNSVLHGVQQIAVDVLHADVESVVNCRVGGAQCISALDGVNHVLIEILQDEVEHGGGAAAGCSSGAGEIVVSRDGAAEGHCQMGVGVDCAGQNQLAGSVNNVGAAVGSQISADCDDLAVLHCDVSLVHLSCGNDGAILDNQIHSTLTFLKYRFPHQGFKKHKSMN